MLVKKKIIIGSRGSKLSLAYSEYAKKLLLETNPQLNPHSIEIKIIKTTGDKFPDKKISELGGKGVFSKQIEEELLKSEIDFAVHSLKDLPTKITPGLKISSIIKRNDPRDAMISYSYNSLSDLRSNCVIGTSSLRRAAQLKFLRKDINVIAMRGNIDTRIKKLKNESLDAIVLSLAGVDMINRRKEIKQIFDINEMLPAAGQGAIAVQTRMDDKQTINFVNKTLRENVNWKIVDIGCGYSANKNASVIADIQDLSNFYKGKNFIKISEKKLPFKDKEFDFVIASHVIEHVEDFEFFVKELERISTKGYIELPTRLADNLVFENKNDHIWWFSYNDVTNQVIASKRNQLIDPFITVSMGKLFEKIFRESFVLELAWEEKIDYKIDNQIRHDDINKISFFKLIRKYLSKKIRTFLR